jgi:hypothetical protein
LLVVVLGLSSPAGCSRPDAPSPAALAVEEAVKVARAQASAKAAVEAASAAASAAAEAAKPKGVYLQALLDDDVGRFEGSSVKTEGKVIAIGQGARSEWRRMINLVVRGTEGPVLICMQDLQDAAPKKGSTIVVTGVKNRRVLTACKVEP